MSVHIIKSVLGAELYRAETESLKAAVEKAVSERANLYRADLGDANLCGANLCRANLYGANLGGANLCRANLYRANLYRADLGDANLRGADLYRADLYRADLYRADLRGAKGINRERCTPLLMLLDQPGKIRAYKLVNENGEGPFNGGLVYEVGKSYSVENASIDSNEQCGAGINLATLDWCLREYHRNRGWKILIAEFTAVDIAAIPTASDGKFRVHRCAIVGEKDLTAILEEKA